MRLVVLLLSVLTVSPIAAVGQVRPPDPRDTIQVDPFRVHPPISPGGAAFRSLLLPGWGQSILDRPGTGAFFVLVEGLAITMTFKSKHQLKYLERVQSEDDVESVERVEAKRNEIQDWAILIAFNHLISAAEAFVAAMLWDFPEELEVQAFSGGRIGAGFRIGLP